MKNINRRVAVLIGVFRQYRNWWLWFFNRCGILDGAKERMIYLRNGLRFYARLDLDNLGAIDDVFIRNEYFNIRNIIDDNAIVIDIGANIGAFSTAAAHRARGATIFSYEPTPETFSRLQRNIGLNNLKNINTFQLAVGGKARETPLFVHPKNSGANTIVLHQDNPELFKEDGSVVRVITLEDVFLQNNLSHCDFLKMDCEGAEFEIIAGASDDLLKKITHIAMEYHRDNKEIKNRLAGLGFDISVVPGSGTAGLLYADKRNS
ncbi:MAG: FkbM family methyltransferase [Candidatus Liptonbacteria bacterium]|nr:FkbM family methyltransferase [Candidatus Liptonbacteria bacterium]